jgi:hypothetical protein
MDSRRRAAGAGVAADLGGEGLSDSAPREVDHISHAPFQCGGASCGLDGRDCRRARDPGDLTDLSGLAYWRRFYPPLVRTLVAHQSADGSWAPEAIPGGAEQYGNAYTTALAVLALSVPDQLLPIFQR